MPKGSPSHPGEVLKTDFLQTMKISASQLAEEMRVPASTITRLVAGRRRISADLAMRLSARFGNSAEFWMNLQTNYDLALLSQASAKRGPRRPKLPPRK